MPNGRRTSRGRRRNTRRRPNGGYGMGSTTRRNRRNTSRSRRSYRGAGRNPSRGRSPVMNYKVIAMDKEQYMICPPGSTGIVPECRGMTEAERHAYLSDPKNPQVFNMK